MNSSTLLYAIAIVAVFSVGMAAVDQPQVQTVADQYEDPPPAPVVISFDEPDFSQVEPVEIQIESYTSGGCPCDCSECLCNAVGQDCPGGVCPTPVQSSVGSCANGSCGVRTPVRSTVQSAARRVSSQRVFSNRPVRTFLGRLLGR